MNIYRIKKDLKYILTNHFIMKIPSWAIRRFFLKAMGMKIGRDARIGIGTIVISPERITIGDRSIINENCHLDGRGGLVIGEDVSISNYSIILTASHKKSSPNFEYFENAVTIENNVWLGTRAMVLDGSYLKQGSIIAAGLVYKGITEKNKVYYPINGVTSKNRNLANYYELDYKAYFR